MTSRSSNFLRLSLSQSLMHACSLSLLLICIEIRLCHLELDHTHELSQLNQLCTIYGTRYIKPMKHSAVNHMNHGLHSVGAAGNASNNKHELFNSDLIIVYVTPTGTLHSTLSILLYTVHAHGIFAQSLTVAPRLQAQNLQLCLY